MRFCYQCWKHTKLCMCAQIKKFNADIDFVFLQHPHERHKVINTAILAHRAISNSEMFWGVDDFDQQLGFRKTIDKYNSGEVGVLYPGEGASQPDDNQLKSLVVLDGTWSEAKKIYQRSEILQDLPCYAFIPEKPSEYRIRKEPQEEYVSTLEAVVEVLKIRSKDSELQAHLLELFRSMVNSQLNFSKTIGNSRHQRYRDSRWQREAESIVNWFLYSNTPERQKKILRGEVDFYRNDLEMG